MSGKSRVGRGRGGRRGEVWACCGGWHCLGVFSTVSGKEWALALLHEPSTITAALFPRQACEVRQYGSTYVVQLGMQWQRETKCDPQTRLKETHASWVKRNRAPPRMAHVYMSLEQVLRLLVDAQHDSRHAAANVLHAKTEKQENLGTAPAGHGRPPPSSTTVTKSACHENPTLLSLAQRRPPPLAVRHVGAQQTPGHRHS